MTEEEFVDREKRRWYFLNRRGWKEIRIESVKDNLPSDEYIINMFGYATNYFKQNHSWIEFNIDNETVVSSEGSRDYDYGILRTIR
ncbi:hypothetical protein D3C74_480480 [compost metagenome]